MVIMVLNLRVGIQNNSLLVVAPNQTMGLTMCVVISPARNGETNFFTQFQLSAGKKILGQDYDVIYLTSKSLLFIYTN